MSRRRLAAGYLALASLFIAVVGAPVVLDGTRHCFHNFDLGIYAQATALLSLAEPNPWLTVRQRAIFNDHFDPILFLAAPFARAFDPALSLISIELALVLACSLPALWLHRRGRLGGSATLLLIAVLLFNRGTVRAVQFPAHPTTWSVLAFALLAAAVLLERDSLVVLALALAFACKEEFPFAGMMLALAYAVRGRRRLGAGLFALSLAWAIVAFAVRPAILGPVASYGPGLLARSLADPLGPFRAMMADPALLRRLAELAALFVPVSLFLWRRRLRPRFDLLAMLLPMLALRFLGSAWYFHYMAPVVVIAAFALFTALAREPLPRWLIVSTATMLVLFNGRTAMHAVRSFTGGGERCPAAPGRLAAIDAARARVLSDSDGAVLAQGNLVPTLVERPELYQVGGPQEPGRRYRFVLVEKPPAGDPWPLSHERYRELTDRWRAQPGVTILRDDRHLFFAEGAFITDR